MLHALLCLLPILVVSMPLLARRYPGERVLVALRGRSRPQALRRRPYLPLRGRLAIEVARGGRLLGSSMAVRPPPAPLPAS